MAGTSKWTLIFDAAKCNGCNNCTIATRDEYVGNSFPGYSESMPLHGHRWIDLTSHERGELPIVDLTYFPNMCRHCEEPACAKAGPLGAVVKRRDGIVIIDPVRSKGARAMVDACPFGAIWWNEEKQIPQHWNFDAHLLDAGWEQPRCAQACPTGAMNAMKLKDSEYDDLLRHDPALVADAGRSRVLYKNTAALQTEFVSGTVVKKIGPDEFDCVAGMKVSLFDGTNCIGSATSDAFGEFKIDGIVCSEPRTLTIIAQAASTTFAFSNSCYLGRLVVA